MQRWPGLVILGLLALSPIFLVAFAGVNVPFCDDFAVAPVLENLRSGRLTAALLWSPYNEHRMPLTWGVFLALGRITHWNFVMVMLVGALLTTAIGLFVTLRLARICPPERAWLGNLTVIAGGLAWFSPVQRENFLWAFQLSFLLVQTWVVLAIFILAREGGRLRTRLLLAILFAVFATLTVAQGLMVWPALLVVALCLDLTPRQRWAAFSVLLLATAVAFGAYFYRYTTPTAGHADLRSLLHRPLDYVQYGIALLGTPATYWVSFGSRLAAASLVAVATAVVGTTAGLVIAPPRALRQAAAPWLGLSVFALGFCAITAYGRLGFGLANSVATSRYTTHSLLFTVACLALVALALRKQWARRVTLASSATGLFVGCVAVLFGAGYLEGFSHVRAEQKGRRDAKALLPFLPLIDRATDGVPGGPLFALCPVPGYHAFETLFTPYVSDRYPKPVPPLDSAAPPAYRAAAPRVEPVDPSGTIKLTGEISTVGPTQGRLVFLEGRHAGLFVAASPVRFRPVSGRLTARYQILVLADLVDRSAPARLWVYDPKLDRLSPVPPS